MYDTQKIADKIRAIAKQKNLTVGGMLSELGLGVNTISDFSKGRALSSISLARIADYLGCSLDDLMGRNSQIDNSISATADTIGVVGNMSAPVSITKTAPKLVEQEQDLLRIYNSLSGRQQLALMSYAYELEENGGK